MVHPKHPKCPKCKKALYKTRVKGGTTKRGGSWKWCRNSDCCLYLIDQTTGKVAFDLNKEIFKSPEIKKFHGDSEVVKKVREEVKKKIQGDSVTHYVLLLAVVSQELGHLEFASTLIRQYGLDEMFKVKNA